MDRPSHLLLIVLVFFAALVAFPVLPSGPSLGASSGDEARRPEPVVLRMGGPAPAGTVELSGKVIDAVGWPLAGARVTSGAAGAAGAAGGAGGAGAADTDADGRFRLRAAENQSAPLTVATRDGMRAHAAAVLPGVEDGLVLVAEMPLPWSVAEPPARGSGVLAGEGSVEDEDRKPVAHALVTMVETGASVRANAHGRYRVALPAGGEAFHLIARDHDGRVSRVEVEGTRQQKGLRPLPTLQVASGHQLTGFLKDGAGNPADRAGLVLSGQGQVRHVVTGSDGGFGIRGLLAGEYVLSVLPHKGWVGFNRELVVGGQAQDLELRLRPERPFTILVQDQAGEPQVGVHLVAREAGYRSAHGETDARGRVILRGLGEGQLTFAAHRGTGTELEVLRYDAGEQRLIVGR